MRDKIPTAYIVRSPSFATPDELDDPDDNDTGPSPLRVLAWLLGIGAIVLAVMTAVGYYQLSHEPWGSGGGGGLFGLDC